MKFSKNSLLLSFLLLSTSCVDPKDLDKLEMYAQEKLAENIKEFSQVEMRSWWSQYYENQALLSLTNAQLAEELIPLMPKIQDDWHQASPKELIKYLVKIHQFNITLRSLLDANESIVSNWGKCEKQKKGFIDLKEKISLHYLSALKIPEVSETYMVGGGSGEGGMSAFFESITTSLGSLFNREKAQEIKKKSKRIKKLFIEKLPSDDSLQEIFKKSCQEMDEESQSLLLSYLPLHQDLAIRVREQWNHYLQEKALIGNFLLQNKIEEIRNRDPEVRELLGEIAVIEALSNFKGMRQNLLKVLDEFSKNKNIDLKEKAQDFTSAYELQLKLLSPSSTLKLESLREELERIKAVLK